MTKRRRKYPIPYKTNITLAIVFVAAIIWILLTVSRFEILELEFLLSCLLFGIFFIPVYSIIHEAEHHLAHPDKKINYYIGVVLSTLFISSFTFIQKAHLNHHKNNRTDYELIDFYYDLRKKWFKKISFFLIHIGFKWISIVVATVLFALLPRFVLNKLIKKESQFYELIRGTDSSNRRYYKIKTESLITVCFHLCLILFFNIEITHYLILYLFHGFVWSSQNYVTHAFSPRSIINGAFNLKMNWLFRLFYLNFNLHLAHHQNPSVPWIYLNKLVKEKNNASYLKAYLKLWKGPRLISSQDPTEYKQMID